jgi:hypothetical protein
MASQCGIGGQGLGGPTGVGHSFGLVAQESWALLTELWPGIGIMTLLLPGVLDAIPGAAGIVCGTWVTSGLVGIDAAGEGGSCARWLWLPKTFCGSGFAAAGTVAEAIAVALSAITRKDEVRNMTVSFG